MSFWRNMNSNIEMKRYYPHFSEILTSDDSDATIEMTSYSNALPQKFFYEKFSIQIMMEEIKAVVMEEPEFEDRVHTFSAAIYIGEVFKRDYDGGIQPSSCCGRIFLIKRFNNNKSFFRKFLTIRIMTQDITPPFF